MEGHTVAAARAEFSVTGGQRACSARLGRRPIRSKLTFRTVSLGAHLPGLLLSAFFAGGHSIFSSPWPLVQGGTPSHLHLSIPW